MLPDAGGEYVYLRQSYGEAAAFLFGWQRFVVAGSASIASLGVGLRDLPRGLPSADAVWAGASSTCSARRSTGSSARGSSWPSAAILLFSP